MQVSKRVRRSLYQSLGLSVLFAGCATGSGGGSASTTAIDWAKPNPFSSLKGLDARDWATQHQLKMAQIIFTGNVNGETEQCGCAVNPKGGLDRRLNYVRELKKDIPTLIVDAGNALFPTKALDPSQIDFQKKRASVILKAHVMMGVAAQNVGYLDFGAGIDFLKSEAQKVGLKLVSTNLIDKQGKALFPTEVSIDLSAGVKALVLGVSAGGAGPAVANGDVQIKDPVQAVSEKLKGVAPETIVVLLSDLGETATIDLAHKIDRQLVIVESRDLSSIEIPLHEGKSMIVRSNLQGQQWGNLQLALNPKAEGWYNSDLGIRFGIRWDGMLEQRSHILAQPDSEDKNSELARLNESAVQVMHYAPGDLTHKVVYRYELDNLTIKYGKTNELTKIMKDLKKIKPQGS